MTIVSSNHSSKISVGFLDLLNMLLLRLQIMVYTLVDYAMF